MRSMYTLKHLVLLSLIACGQSANQPSQLFEAWNSVNDPVRMDAAYVRNLRDLPLSGELEVTPWTDSYWPNMRAGLANRWAAGFDVDNFKYELHPLLKLKTLSEDALRELSPAEKYDIYIGNYDYDLVKYERQRNSPEDEGWFGLCHGWAPASLNFVEPNAVTLLSQDGIAVPFGSSDIKALLTFVQQLEVTEGRARSLGGRCNIDIDEQPGRARDPECRDVNAGAWHVVLANQIGIAKQGFVADMTRDRQVWNHPVFAYESEKVSESAEVYAAAAPGTKLIATMRTKVRYVVEQGAAWDPRPAYDFPSQLRDRTLEYQLELDAEGNVLGGEWLDSSGERPDFLWVQDRPQFSGYFVALQKIYEEATKKPNN